MPAGRTADLENGRMIYQQSCIYCHGPDGVGGQGGGKPLTSALTLQDIMNILGAGRNAMPAFSTMLTPEQIHDTGSYILEQLLKQ